MNPNLIEIKPDDYFIIDMMYASLKNNMIGIAVYQDIGIGNRAFVHKDLWKKLQRIIPYLKENKLKIKICDAYRPPLAHAKMKEIIPQPGFFASQPERSLHCHGTAIDVCLCDIDGNELIYPTKVDAFDNFYAKQVQEGNLAPFFEYLQEAHHDYVCASRQALTNREELKKLMESIGLEAISNEWWHYELPEGRSEKYPMIEYP